MADACIRRIPVSALAPAPVVARKRVKRSSPMLSILLSIRPCRHCSRRLRGADGVLSTGPEEWPMHVLSQESEIASAPVGPRGWHTHVPRLSAATCVRESRAGWRRAIRGSVMPNEKAGAWDKLGGILA